MSEIALTIDAQRTRLQQRFFEVFGFDSTEELLSAISQMEVNVDSIARSLDSRNFVYSGWVYWYLFVKGYLQFAATEKVDDNNIYLDYLLRYYAPRGHDPGVVRVLSNPSSARERIARRFSLIPAAADAATSETKVWDIDPILVIQDTRSERLALRIYPLDSAEPIGASLVDGWHRLFAARMFGVAAVPGQLVRKSLSPSPEDCDAE